MCVLGSRTLNEYDDDMMMSNALARVIQERIRWTSHCSRNPFFLSGGGGGGGGGGGVSVVPIKLVGPNTAVFGIKLCPCMRLLCLFDWFKFQPLACGSFGKGGHHMIPYLFMMTNIQFNKVLVFFTSMVAFVHLVAFSENFYHLFYTLVCFCICDS